MEWLLLKEKSVQDFDGFWTDYSWWWLPKKDLHVFILGDTEIYNPENTDWDWETDDVSSAQEWFDSVLEDYFYEETSDYRTGLYLKNEIPW